MLHEDALDTLANSKDNLTNDVKILEEELTGAKSLTASKDAVVREKKGDESKCKERASACLWLSKGKPKELFVSRVDSPRSALEEAEVRPYNDMKAL